MKISRIAILLALTSASTIVAASTPSAGDESGSAAGSAAAPRWRIEVRDARVRPGDRDIAPTSGRLEAAFDLTIGGTPGRLGENVPYVDAATIEIDGNAGSTDTLVLRDGLTVSLSGTPDRPTLHSEDVAVVSYDQIMVKGVTIIQPKTATTSLAMPFNPSGQPVVLGGYKVGKPGSTRMRIFVIRPA